MKKTPYYKVNTDRKVITVDRSVMPTAADKEEVAMYLSAGYKLAHKSEAKSKKAKANAANLPNKKQLEKIFEDTKYEKAKETYDKYSSNFFKARSEALKKIAEIDKELKEKEENKDNK